MFEKLFARFAPKEKAPTPNSAGIIQGEAAISETSVLYKSGDFEKYNPDGLIGRKGTSIYRKMMIDEQVTAVVKFKRDAITSRDYTFVLDAEKHGISREEAYRRITMSHKYIEKMRGSFSDVLNGIMTAMYQGFSMSEKIYEIFEYEGKSFWGVGAIKVKPYDTFFFNVDEFGNIVSLTQKVGTKVIELDIKKFIHFVINPDKDEHYGESELRQAYRAWFSKDAMIKFRNIWLERHAGGFRYAQIKDGVTLTANSPEYRALKTVMESITMSTGLIMPNAATLETSYPVANIAFKEAIQDQDTAIARAMLVPNLLGVSPQGDVGSYSQSTNQLEAFFWTLNADAARLEDTLNEQLFRPLGEINFGDDAWPRIKFKPVSMAKMLEIVNTWKDLVTAGAVKVTVADEDYIREILDMPDRTPDGEDEDAATATDPSTALNGAQVASMVDVIVRVGTGEIPKETAIQILISAFPINRATAEALINPIQIKEPVIPPQLPGGQPDASEPKDQPNNPQADDDPNKPAGTGKPIIPDDPGVGKVDETIVGRSKIEITTFEKAKKKARARVAFAVIDKTSDNAVENNTLKVGKALGAIIKDLIVKGKSGGELKEDVSDNISALVVDSKLKTKLNKVVYAMLQEGHAIGTKHAQNEVDSAKGESFSRKFDRERFEGIAEDFFKVNSFKVTGNLSTDAIRTIEGVILNGARYDWTWDRVEEEIYRSFAQQGLLTPEEAVEALGDALGVDNPDARLRTMVRTNTFDAINTARYDYFTDPGLNDFVQAFEYSAVLDSRTTDICRHLDDLDEGNHSVEWYEANSEYRPPNHYNCRSLLIAVTKYDIDSFVEGPEPTVEPQAGFG